MCLKSNHLSGFHGRLAVVPRGSVLSPVLGLRAQAEGTEPVSVRAVRLGRKIYAVLVPIKRWATNEMTANNSSK
jgi:hypothetical protein